MSPSVLEPKIWGPSELTEGSVRKDLFLPSCPSISLSALASVLACCPVDFVPSFQAVAWELCTCHNVA